MTLQYLAILRVKPDAPKERLVPLLKSEATRAWELLASGVLRSVHYIQGSHGPAGAALLLECGTGPEAEAYVQQLPLVEHDLVTAEVLPLTPFTGFASLFAGKE